MKTWHEMFIEVEPEKEHFYSHVLKGLVEGGEMEKIKAYKEIHENAYAENEKESYHDLFSLLCVAAIKKGIVLNNECMDDFYSQALYLPEELDSVSSFGGAIESLVYFRYYVTDIDKSYLKPLVLTAKSAAVNYLEGRLGVARDMMNLVLGYNGRGIILLSEAYNNLNAAKGVYSSNGKKSKYPHRKYVDEVARLTTLKYQNVSVGGLFEKIESHMRNDRGLVPPTEKSFRLWIKAMGYNPQRPFLDKREYDLVLPECV